MTAPDPFCIDLSAEFDQAVLQRQPHHVTMLRRHGVSLNTINLAGDIGVARIVPSGWTYVPDSLGFPTLILGVWYPGPPSLEFAADKHLVLELIAIRLADPWTWWRRRGGEGLVLGPHWHDWACDTGQPIRILSECMRIPWRGSRAARRAFACWTIPNFTRRRHDRHRRGCL